MPSCTLEGRFSNLTHEVRPSAHKTWYEMIVSVINMQYLRHVIKQCSLIRILRGYLVI